MCTVFSVFLPISLISTKCQVQFKSKYVLLIIAKQFEWKSTRQKRRKYVRNTYNIANEKYRCKVDLKANSMSQVGKNEIR